MMFKLPSDKLNCFFILHYCKCDLDNIQSIIYANRFLHYCKNLIWIIFILSYMQTDVS